MKRIAHRGFTLAEVLIALAIIGVIAVMTIPNLMVSVGNSKTKAQLQKFLADMNQAVMLYEGKHGIFSVTTESELANTFAEALKTQEVDVNTSTSIKNASGTPVVTGSHPYLIMANGGEIVAFTNIASACNGNGSAGVCARVYVDLNGQITEPNKLGTDVFVFSIVKRKDNFMVEPFGATSMYGTSYYLNYTNGKCSGTVGDVCAAELIKTN
jgi:prepilin-type N-terminal cleavage/methylation domain-containing protein